MCERSAFGQSFGWPSTRARVHTRSRAWPSLSLLRARSAGPLLSEETLDPLALDPNATDEGAARALGQPAELFSWFNYARVPVVHKLIKMQQVDFYADVSGATAVPIFSETKLIPYGRAQTGSQNTSYTGYIAGAPPADKFKIAGIDTCPQARNCQLEGWQAHRLASRRFSEFYRHQ